MLFSKTKILIIEDHPIYINGMKSYISSAIKDSEIHLAYNGKSAIRKACSGSFDVIFVDLELPDISGMDVIKTLKSKNINSKFVVNSFYCSVFQTISLLNLGVNAVMQKCDKEEDILRALKFCKSNKTYISKSIKKEIGGYQSSVLSFRITNRENEIINLIKRGFTISQISSKLCISASTVNNHKAKIFKKLKVKSSIELINVCKKNNLI